MGSKTSLYAVRGTYYTIFEEIKELCSVDGLTFKHQIIYVDFEVAEMRSVQDAFPETLAKCCRFYLGHYVLENYIDDAARFSPSLSMV